ncbi:MAG TPA: hypothetical protein VH914_13130 [Acidimicrobiia bacterium]|nr:hypothetical protein [Acidimicrobiia bacterium]
MRATPVALVLVACTHQLPPPEVPTLVTPKPLVALGPPGPGEGDLLIDTVGEPADVVEIVGQGSARQTRPVCTTPCEAHVALGFHELEFHSYQSAIWRGDGRVTVGQRPSAYRYALGHTSLTPTTGSLWLVAGILAITGASLAIGSLAGGSVPLLAVSIGITGVGVGGLYAYRPDVQQGAGIQWSP